MNAPCVLHFLFYISVANQTMPPELGLCQTEQAGANTSMLRFLQGVSLPS